MKKIITLILFLLLVFVNVFSFGTFAFWGFSSKDSLKSVGETRKIDLENGFYYLMDIKQSDEILGRNANGDTETSKKAKVEVSLFESENNKQILELCLQTKFIYDGSKVIVSKESCESELKEKSLTSNWRTGGNAEVLEAENQAIYSGTWGVYFLPNNRINSKWSYIDDFHIDLICSKTGQLNFNVKGWKPLDDPNMQEKIISNKNNRLDDEVFRKDIISEVEFDYDNSDTENKYIYVTRNIYSTFSDMNETKFARFNIKANFRYNKATQEVKCLSTLKSKDYKDKKGGTEVYIRTGNSTKKRGGAYADLEVRRIRIIGETYFNDIINVFCDFNGDITQNIFPA